MNDSLHEERRTRRPISSAVASDSLHHLYEARRVPGSLAYGAESEDLFALVHPDKDGGLRLCMIWEGIVSLGMTVTATAGIAFDPERDLSDLNGETWRAIHLCDEVPEGTKKSRAWETWLEMFEGLSLIQTVEDEAAAFADISSPRWIV